MWKSIDTGYMDRKLIEQIGRKYNKFCLWVIAGATLIALLAINICNANQFVNPLAISVLYALASSIAYGLGWRSVAGTSPDTLSKFYLVASALRMLLALMVAVVFCVVSRDRESIINFIIVFAAFYVVMLIFDGVFFARLERKLNQKI